MNINQQSKSVLVGKFGRVHGVHGWLKVHSFTQPQENILQFTPWLVAGRPVAVANSMGLRVQLEGVDTPEMAQHYVNLAIYVARNLFPALPEGEYYWVDLIGLQVVTQHEQELGVVTDLIATGAHDVLVVKGTRTRLIPYVSHVIIDVALAAGIITVAWDPEYAI